MSLKSKFRIIVGLAAAAVASLSASWLSSERSRILAEKEETAAGMVEATCPIASDQQKLESEVNVNRHDAQRQAIRAIRAMRYGDGNYVWITDLHPTMIIHPTPPQLDGMDVSNYRDPTGKALFAEMTSTVRTNGAGYVRY
jgi:methyl-accepting chemotaxis protein